MIDWRKGGLSGSVLRLARQEMKAHLRDNSAARRVRYSLPHRIVRKFFSIGSFGSFLRLYILVDLAFLIVEALFANIAPHYTSFWQAFDQPPSQATNSLLLSVSGYFLAAQAGALGIITLALALVTLIAQRESSASDIALYYHESMAFQIVASSVALLAVLAIQLLWPMQYFLHYLELGSQNLSFEFALLTLHLVWLCANLAAIAYFIDTTFNFVQQSKREALRERYTANIVYPRDLKQRLCEHFYLQANQEIGQVDQETNFDLPSAAFGFDTNRPSDIEISTRFTRVASLQDVRMIWVRWVFRRWSKRCRKGGDEGETAAASLGVHGPRLWFTPHMFQPMRNTVPWCQREGGVPLTTLEKLVLRCSFVFRKTRDDD